MWSSSPNYLHLMRHVFFVTKWPWPHVKIKEELLRSLEISVESEGLAGQRAFKFGVVSSFLQKLNTKPYSSNVTFGDLVIDLTRYWATRWLHLKLQFHTRYYANLFWPSHAPTFSFILFSLIRVLFSSPRTIYLISGFRLIWVVKNCQQCPGLIECREGNIRKAKNASWQPKIQTNIRSFFPPQNRCRRQILRSSDPGQH